MYPVSDAWVRQHSEILAPEGFVELSFHIPQLQETLVYTKRELMSFTHEQTGSLVSGELPKNHIEFSLDNTNDIWNPSQPRGLGRYLSERLKITLRYGFDLDGVTEWIPGGVFYLKEWHTPANGLEASFVARDVLEFMMDVPYYGALSGTLYDVATRAVALAALPSDATVRLCDELKNYEVAPLDHYSGESTAEVLQRCANAACCVMYQTRDGVLVIERKTHTEPEYVVSTELSYTYPEITYSRPLKQVRVTYYDGYSATFLYGFSGETQTLDNEFICTHEQATEVAKWVCNAICTRRQISGEFRGDPRLDVFDAVEVESKYGVIGEVVLTNIRYTFSGTFKASYSGYIHGTGTPFEVYSNEIHSGEVI